ncbi:hypothetical protein BURPS406E_H0207 [Burkholderia pseudomallei 406e]|nr:hypothetical protein BURPS406E_H0207 [Burkholderia pseudomallei 406e]
MSAPNRKSATVRNTLRWLRAASSTRSRRIAAIGRNAESTTAASGSGPAQTSRRPAAHSSHSAASGAPCGVSRDVHARIAVSRKPTMIAAENPNTIS